MLPVLSSLVVGSESASRSQAFTLSLAYVVPMALTYAVMGVIAAMVGANLQAMLQQDRKSTRLNSSHVAISYAVFCLKKKKTEDDDRRHSQDKRNDAT